MAPLTIQQTFELAVQHHQAGRLHEAEILYRQILAQQPGYVGALYYLGLIAHRMGQNDIAIDLIRRAIALNPNLSEAHSDLGNVLKDKGELDEAIASYRRAIALNSKLTEAYSNLGAALKDKGQLDEAIAAARQAIVLNPNNATAHSNLGAVLADKRQLDEAIAAYRQAIALDPGNAAAHYNLGNALKGKGQLDEAVAAFRRATALNPNFPQAHNNLGNALREQGQFDGAIAACRQAVALKPNFHLAHSNLLFTLNYHPAFEEHAIAEEHRRWNRQHAEPLQKFIQLHSNDRNPDRRLRIGYASPDFREHAVAPMVLPLLECHDREHFEIFCYAEVLKPDETTERFRAHADQWRSTVGLSDEQAANLIRQDQIDILVDLAGHTTHNRLLVFARKPAPVQVTRQGYPNTTGLTTIDYRMTDAYADPPGLSDTLHSEKLIRLPQANWIFQPPENCPPPSQRPQTASITFGCFNNFTKVTEPMMRVWAKILASVPGSTLLLKAKALASPEGQQRVRRIFQSEHISPERVELVGLMESAVDHLALYNRVSIGLDPFPYHGTTTTCDALWMGVPVITLAGRTHVSRVGVSLLSNMGLPELIAESPEDYIRIAVELANDLPRLRNLHSTLRQRMEQSPLMDAPKFARNIESAYRRMWHTWCETVLPKS